MRPHCVDEQFDSTGLGVSFQPPTSYPGVSAVDLNPKTEDVSVPSSREILPAMALSG